MIDTMIEWASTRAVVFDMDGVVVDSEPLLFTATAEIFAEYGVTLRPEDVYPGIGAGVEYLQCPRDRYGLAYLSLETLMAERERRFRLLAQHRLAPVAGVLTVMHAVRHRGMKTALASSADTNVVYDNLRMAHLDPGWFDVIVDSTRIAHKKPAPDIFLQAAAQLGIPPAQCVVIEDAPAGIVAARRSGMSVIAVASSLPRTYLAEADAIVASMQELGQYLAHPCTPMPLNA